MTTCDRCSRTAERDDLWLPVDTTLERWVCPHCTTVDDLTAYAERSRNAAAAARTEAGFLLDWADRAEERAERTEAEVATRLRDLSAIEASP